MISRVELDSILKVQSDAFQANIQNVISIYETRLSKLEAEFSAAKLEISELKQTSRVLQELISSLQNKPTSSAEASNVDLKQRVDDLEDRSRRNNLKITGLPEEHSETWEQSATKVLKLIKEKCKVTGKIEIERAHRIGKKSNRPRPIIVKFLRYQDREKILKSSKNLKDTEIYINEDLCGASVEKRKALLPQLKAAREQGKIAFFSHTKLIIREKREEEEGEIN